VSDKIQVGDRVRLTIEGAVEKVWSELDHTDHGLTIDGEVYGSSKVERCHVEVIEKAKPPVVTFQPGDRLRRKHWPNPYEVTLGDDGYLHHCSGRVTYSQYGGERGFFNPENFDKVELHEAPL
jgi:hypothetical protein